MLRRNIEHFLKKRKYEKLGFSELNQTKRNFFFYFKRSLFLIFIKTWRPAFTFYFWLINLWRNNEHRAMRKKLQKHSFADTLQNKCSQKFRKFHRKIPVLKSLFNKAADLKTCKFIMKILQHRCHEKETTEAAVRRYSSKLVF